MSLLDLARRYLTSDGTAWRRLGRGDVVAASRRTDYGAYRPVAGTSAGLLPGWVDSQTAPGVGQQQLTALNGDQLSLAAGTTLTNRDIFGFVHGKVANLTLINCKVRGSAAAVGPGIELGLVHCEYSGASNIKIQDCELTPDFPSPYITGIKGHDFTLERSYIHECTDGIGIQNTQNLGGPANVNVWGSVVKHLSYWSPDGFKSDGTTPLHSDNRTHNDCIQIQGNTNISIVGNDLDADASTTSGNGQSTTSPAPLPASYQPSVTGQCIGITPNVTSSPVGNVVIDRNWLDKGAQSITVVINNNNVVANTITITANRFGRLNPNLTKEGSTARRPIAVQNGVNAINGIPANTAVDNTLGNVYADDSTPITIYRLDAP